MVQSSAADVGAFLDEITPRRQEALRRVRAMCVEELTGFTEAMRYGMATYNRDDTSEFAFASQKQYISLYIRPDVRDAHAERLKDHDMGKSCLRFRDPAKIDFELVRALLRATAATRGAAG